jgi:Icc-related predicted phosphoesterase
MRLLLFSDVHRDLSAVRSLVEMSAGAEVAVCAGDLAVMREGLQEVVDVLSGMEIPSVLVAGNGESNTELVTACKSWPTAHVLHGSGIEIQGVQFWGLGGAIPVTRFGDWSFDLSEDAGHELLVDCPDRGVLVSHSPPFGHVDGHEGQHLGSRSVLDAIIRSKPMLVVCGHIHSCWREESAVGATRVINAGPDGMIVEI